MRQDYSINLLIELRELSDQKFNLLVDDLQRAKSIVRRCQQFKITDEEVQKCFELEDIRQVKSLKRGLIKLDDAEMYAKFLRFMLYYKTPTTPKV